MSNHVTATQNSLIMILYSDLITYVPTYDYKEEYVIDLVKQGIKNYEHYKQQGEDYPGITWHIDSVLNANGFAQCMVNIKYLASHLNCVSVNYPYDLGENETEQDVQKHYPHWRN